MSSGDGRERHPREMTVPQPKSLSPSSSVGPRPSEEASGEKGRRGDMAENIVEEARRSITPPQPAEARRGSGIGSAEGPRATYRVQLNKDFGFNQAAAVADYLTGLGVSHFYASPYLQAAPGSTHGYDVVDHRRV